MCVCYIVLLMQCFVQNITVVGLVTHIILAPSLIEKILCFGNYSSTGTE